LGGDQLYVCRAERRLRQRRGRLPYAALFRFRGRLPGRQLHVPGLRGPVRRGGDLHGDVGRVPGGRLRIGGDQLYGRLAERRVRQRRGQLGSAACRDGGGSLAGGQLHVPGLGGQGGRRG